VVNVHIIHHDVYVRVGVSTRQAMLKEIKCMVYEHVIHHERIVIVYHTMGTQIEHTSMWHNNSIFIHGEHMVHTSIGIMQRMGLIKISSNA
jgi:hypothetical protein